MPVLPAKLCLFVLRCQALIDAPTETRRIMAFKRMTLTDLKVEIPRLASKKVLTAAFNSAGAAQGWDGSC
jgi:large subunit ribosomal protein L14e